MGLFNYKKQFNNFKAIKKSYVPQTVFLFLRSNGKKSTYIVCYRCILESSHRGPYLIHDIVLTLGVHLIHETFLQRK